MAEVVSAGNQTLPISDGERDKFTAYSAAVHKAIVMVNTGIIGLLQLMNQHNSSVFETHKPAFLCFSVFFLLYAVLRVCEAIDVRLQYRIISRLVGNISHMLGALAALVLASVLCRTFAFVLLVLWFLWLSYVAYDTIKIIYREAKSMNNDGFNLGFIWVNDLNNSNFS